ncbi:MAG: SPOR domain-containing protein [Candidatus Omnitrophica bacterium]|nr:SPOR domain-containing protein [Candidatus Omnitrophota bacterium]
MKNSEFKNDFFVGEIDAKKSRGLRLSERYDKQRFLPQIKMPVEYVVIITIAVIILMTISYAVGVERGKRVKAEGIFEAGAAEGRAKESSKERVIIEAGFTETGSESSLEELVVTETTAIQEEVTPEQEKIIPQTDPEEKPAPSFAKGNYIIQLATFKHRDPAEDEARKLEEKGIQAQITEAGDWYQVYAVGYKTISEAKKAKKELVEKYGDCYIRKVK